MSLRVEVIEDTASQMLKNLSENLRPKVHVKIMGTGQQMVGYAFGICAYRTGYLRSTIFFSAAGELEYSFGASADYALFVEMGTRFMAPHPFIRPSLESYTTEFLEAIVQGFMEAAR